MWVYDSSRKIAANPEHGAKISIGGSGSNWFLISEPSSIQFGTYASESAAQTALVNLLSVLGYVNVP